jgi:hypothetical protein
MQQLYICHEIRGAAGEEASEAFQRGNISKACEKAQVLIDHFQEVDWVVPHANEIVNELYFQGKVSGSDIIEVECGLIRSRYDGIVVIGSYYSNTGVAEEINAASSSFKFIHFMNDVMEDDRAELAEAIKEWEE